MIKDRDWQTEEELDLFIQSIPELERPVRVPFGVGSFYTKETAPLVWASASKFSSHGKPLASSHSPGEHTWDGMMALVAKGSRRNLSCQICHIPFPHGHKHIGEEAKLCIERDICWHCAFWELRKADSKAMTTIIDGHIYSPGNRTQGSMRGMGGRRFDIEYIAGPHKGKRITTYDLWSGSTFPEHWREGVEDTAKFLGGAEKVELSGPTMTCFNSSDGQEGPYPLPRSIGLR